MMLPNDVPELESIRTQISDGPRARQLLVTLMADFWLGEGALAPSGVLVELLAGFGVSEPGTRTLLSRLAKAGRLVPVREGRRTFYRLSEPARTRLTSGLRQIAEFDQLPARPADQWTCIAFSLPEERRGDRQRLRQGLSWLGFAPLFDGVWVSPRPVAEQASALVASMGVEAAAVFEGDIRGIGTVRGNPADAWDIPLMESLYGQFLEVTEPKLTKLAAGEFDAMTALSTRTQLVNVWRAYPLLDPGLPASLLPEGWPRARAQSVFVRLYDGLAPIAMRRVRESVEAQAPEYLRFVSVHSLSTGMASWAA